MCAGSEREGRNRQRSFFLVSHLSLLPFSFSLSFFFLLFCIFTSFAFLFPTAFPSFFLLSSRLPSLYPSVFFHSYFPPFSFYLTAFLLSISVCLYFPLSPSASPSKRLLTSPVPFTVTFPVHLPFTFTDIALIESSSFLNNHGHP